MELGPSALSRRAFLGSAATAVAGVAAQTRPNIVLMVADDLGYGELGCQGNPQIPTPHIDGIARRGVRFTNGYVTAPYCSPSRAGLLTGRYQTRFGHELNPVGKQNLLPHVGLPEKEKSMALYLREAGYRTSLVGKWHLGGAPPFHPLNHGFDEFFGFLHEGHFYVPPGDHRVLSHLRVKEPPYDDDNPLMRGREQVAEPEYLTRAFAREACAFIDRNAKKPFFLYMPFNSVHSPMQAERKDVDGFAHIKDEHRRIFAAMLSSLDMAVGSVVERLRRHRLERNTIVVFLSDNGGPVQELTSSNEPLRGQKGQLYDGGIRVPFVMEWAGRIRAGQTVDQPVTSLDLLPTFLNAAGVKRTPVNPLDGLDLVPVVAGKGAKERDLYWRYDRSGALRSGDWKIVRQMRRNELERPWELYNVMADIGEARNLAGEHPDRLKEMLGRWEKLSSQMAEPTLRT